MNANNKPNGFLTDLEGLRSIAVLAVLFFHIDDNVLSGGFLGVDLFFVISGYVVTKVLLAKGIKNHILNFYLTRFHRLIPASAITILLTIVAFGVFSNQGVDVNFYISALSAISSTSNINFLLTSGYWSDELSINPFLHFWSLSVEEQFYLIWPAILFFVVNQCKKNSILFLIVLCILGVALLYMVDGAVQFGSFYLMPARMFQFCIGALAFFLSKKTFNSNLRTLSFLIGIISFSFFTYLINGRMTSIFIVMVVPTLLSFLILFGLQTKVSLFFLSNKLFRFIGKISYSLYLVHWPIIVLLKINFGGGVLVQAFMLIISFFLGYLLYENIEKKCRIQKVIKKENSRILKKRKLQLNLSIFSFVAFTTVFGVIISASNQPSTLELAFTDAGKTTYPDIGKNKLSTKTRKNIWSCQTYEVGRISGESKYKLVSDLDLSQCLQGRVILLGDSWGPAAAESLFYIYGADNVATLNSAGCMPIPFYSNKHYPDCEKMNSMRFDITLLSKYTHVFISTNWDNWSKLKLKKLLGFFKESNTNIYLFSTRPTFVIPVPAIDLVSNITPEAKLKEKLSIDLSNYEKIPLEINNDVLQGMILEYKNIKIIDWYAPLKNSDGKLIAYTPDGNLIYRDKSHLTNYGMEFLAHSLAKKIVWH